MDKGPDVPGVLVCVENNLRIEMKTGVQEIAKGFLQRIIVFKVNNSISIKT